MAKEKRIFSYILDWLILGYIILFIGTSNVFASTYDTQSVTWYYRKTSDESTLLSTVKDVNTPVSIVNGEFLNGFTTRQDYTFNKGLQYMINYKLLFLYQDGIDSLFRNDTLDRLIKYSWVDPDFKLLNTVINQTKYLCEAGICAREFTISQQVLTLNNTGGIRFGVYTTENKSIGFYSPPSPPAVDITLSNYINIEENSSSVIIDQNNQIIQGQDGINNNITNSTNTITGSITETEDNLNSSIQSSQDNINQNIDDMEDAIVDSNKETQDVIKDQFNSCRDSYNLLDVNEIYSLTGMKQQTITLLPGNYTLSAKSIETEAQKSLFLFRYKDGSGNKYVLLEKSNPKMTFTLDTEADLINIYSSDNYSNSQNVTTIFTELMLNKGTTALSYEPYGEEICSNKLDEQNDKLDGIQGALTDSSSPDTSGLENSAGWLPAGPLDSVLNLPLSLFNALTTNLNKSCNPINIPLPYVNKNITLPCINTLYNQIGITSFLSWVGVIVSGLMLYTYLLKLYKWIEDRISLNETHNVDSWGGL